MLRTSGDSVRLNVVVCLIQNADERTGQVDSKNTSIDSVCRVQHAVCNKHSSTTKPKFYLNLSQMCCTARPTRRCTTNLQQTETSGVCDLSYTRICTCRSSRPSLGRRNWEHHFQPDMFSPSTNELILTIFFRFKYQQKRRRAYIYNIFMMYIYLYDVYVW